MLIFSNENYFRMPRYAEGAAGGGGSDKSFCSKPTRGWLHTDQTILNEGVTFNVRVKYKTLKKHKNKNSSESLLKPFISVHRMSRNSNFNESFRFCAEITSGKVNNLFRCSIR